MKAFVLGSFVQACCWMVPRLPHPGETLAATELHFDTGGKGLNVAICLQRLGITVNTLIGCGKDSAGDELLSLLQQENIDTPYVYRLNAPSGRGAGWIGADGQNAIAVYLGANLLLTPTHIQQAKASIMQADVVYAQFETAPSAIEAAFAIAHTHQIPTLLNPSPWPETSSQAWMKTLSALRHTTHTLIVNEVEAAQLELESLWMDWTSLQRIVITQGAKGSCAWERKTPHQCLHIPAPSIQVVDTIGAGDAFASGYCAAFLANQPLSEALRWGNACGAHLAAHQGVLHVLPTRKRLQQLLQLL